MKTVTPQIPKGACGLAIMAKAPIAGEVKTRLTPLLTREESASLSSCFLQDTATLLSAVGDKHLVHRIGVYTPADRASLFANLLPPGFLLVPQRGEAFGQRLAFATDDLFALGFSSVCLIDSDSPTLPREVFEETIGVLTHPSGSNLVIGPATDGGYYLIGLRRPCPSLFEEITWSSELVFEQTIVRARKLNLKSHILPEWYDVDDARSLQRLCEELFGSEASPGQKNIAPATRHYLEGLLKKEGRGRIWPEPAKR